MQSLKLILRGIFAAVLLVIASTAVFSQYDFTENQKLILFLLDENKNIDDIKVVRDNAFYRNSGKYGSTFEIPDEDVETAPYIELLDENGDVVYGAEFFTDFYAPYSENIKRIRVYSHMNGNIIFDKWVSFCNHNGVCEPCDGSGCVLSENHASCDDCGSGGKDLYCDLKKDNICDPDCNGIDMDCRGCAGGECYYEDSMDSENTCSYLNGEVCGTVEECVGSVVDYNEQGYCCTGSCVDPSVDEEYIPQEPEEVEFTGGSDFVDELVDTPTDPVELFDINYNNSVPVEDDSKKIYCSKVGKSVCGMFERCVNGNYVYSDDEGDGCCTGECVPLPDKGFNEEYKKAFGEEYKKPSEPLVEETKPLEKIGEFVYASEIKKIGSWWFLLLVIPAIAAIFAFAAIKRKKAEREGRLRYEYDYYRNYGYSDEQLRDILRQRGWEKGEIKNIIKK